MHEYILQIDAECSLTGVLELMREICSAHGVKRQSYHFSPIFSEPTSIETVVHAAGFTDEWLALYQSADFRAHDPIPARTYEHGAMLRWQDAINNWRNSPEQLRYFDAMHVHGLIYGFGLPLYGPRGRTAYAGIDFDCPLEEVDPAVVAMVRLLAQSGHQRLCNIIDESREHSDLSEREKEVLTWMARGKSNTDIGTILALSPETVKTYRERIYLKLGINDRIGAVIRGLKLGLVSI